VSAVQFCEDCGSMMRPEDGEMVCADCGATAGRDEDRAAEFVSTAEQTHGDVIESDPDADFEGKPTADDVTCEECGHGEAWYTIKQTGSADEPPTRFFKCKDCGHRWREYN
jgi:DNA-directed RNA polymerase subunit M